MAILTLPLPVMLVYFTILQIQEKIKHRKYYKIVKRYFDNPGKVSPEQLSAIFPDKNLTDLCDIAYQLHEEGTDIGS